MVTTKNQEIQIGLINKSENIQIQLNNNIIKFKETKLNNLSLISVILENVSNGENKLEFKHSKLLETWNYLIPEFYNRDFEVNEEKGVFYFSSEKSTIGGFDFAILNHKRNLTSLRNLCFGELHYHEGEKRWEEFLTKNKNLVKIATKLEGKDKIGVDIEFEKDKETPLIVGEIQFGNWALAYRDFFKVLKANVQNSIDCLVYVVPTGNLEKMLSDGIVTFDTSFKILNDFSKVISVPVWVIGLDIKE